MKDFILIIFLSISVFGFCQTPKELNQIDKDYKNYLKTVFEPSFKTPPSNSEVPTNIIFGELTNSIKKQMTIGSNITFSIGYGKNKNKQLAAIMYGLKHFSTFQFLGDDYEQIHANKDLVFKEYLRVKVHITPDTGNMELIQANPINKLEKLNTFQINGYRKNRHPYIISYYTSHQENSEGIYQTAKIIIKQNGKTIYSSNKAGSKVNIKHNNSINRNHYVYKYKGRNHLISGGMMNHTIEKVLNNIKEEKHLHAVKISNVKDYYGNENKDLKRVSNTGKLTFNNAIFEDVLKLN